MRRITCLVLGLVLALSLAACGSASNATTTAAAAETTAAASVTGVEDGVLTIAMECAYAPYNWTQGDGSNGAVPIANVPGSYANGYDVMIGKKIAEANGWQLEVIQADWDSLVPGVRRAQRAGGFRRPLLLRLHRLRHQEGQPLCFRHFHCRPGRRQVHCPDRYHLV